MRKGRQLSIALFISFFSFLYQYSSAIDLSDSARVSLLTCGAGEDLYSAFGHNGIRVTDYRQGFDVVFNYGTFDFNQPGFYVNFVRGKMRYMLSVDNYQDFINQYIYEERSVAEQELNLSPADRQKIFAYLFTNAEPENREYYYDFFWDNCATRPRDVFDTVLGSRLKHTTTNCGFEQDKTMHDMLRIYVHDMPWVDFGFDLGLGLNCEIEATPRHQTFLPDYLAKYFACSTLDGQPLVGKTQSILSFPPHKTGSSFPPLYLTLLLLLAGVAVFVWEKKKDKHLYWFDASLFLITGLAGLLLLSLWLFTVHYSVPKNLNMLWLLPTHILPAFLLLRKNKPSWLRYYFMGTCALMILLLLLWKFNPQPYNIAFMPVIILMGIRSFNLYTKLK